MDWRLKCAAMHALAAAPWLHRAIQRATGSAFLAVTDTYFKLHQRHATLYRKVHPGRALEFGGGRHFLTPLLLSHAGATEVLVYDLERLSTPAIVNHTIVQLATRLPGNWPRIMDFDDLARRYRIRYFAPADAGNMGLADGSIDFVCSTSTLEHINADDIRRILSECARVTRPGALFSHAVDYQDHYSYADKSLSPFNFYRFSERAWRWFNPSNHFQNRLRHCDYEGLFAEQPLTIVEVKPWRRNHVDVPLASNFRHYQSCDLLTAGAYFELARKQRAATDSWLPLVPGGRSTS